MAFLSFPNIRVAGISACVPKEIEDNWVSPLYSEEERSVLINSVGIFQRRRSPEGVCSSDLCFAAAEKLKADELFDEARHRTISCQPQLVSCRIGWASLKNAWLSTFLLVVPAGFTGCLLWRL